MVEEHYSGLDLSVEVKNLEAFVNYTFVLRACTSGGCGDSRPVVAITPEDKPRKIKPPKVVALSNTSLVASWEPPEEPNGNRQIRF